MGINTIRQLLLDDTCTTCGKRVSSERGGSLTQWIFGTDTCLCNKKSIEPIASSETSFCRKCGLPLATRQGTFTQWIFRSDTCRCGAPQGDQLSVNNTSQSHLQQPAPEFSKGEEEAPAVGSNLFCGPIELFADRYEILEHLGSGATSQVDRATDRFLNKTVALKRLHRSRLNAEKILRFQQEAKILGNLRHPNLTCVLDCGVSEDNQPYLVMECEDGATLETTLKEQRFAMETAVRIAVQICEAMAYVHKHNVVHRDLNSRNIMLVERHPTRPVVRILDFGVARFLGSVQTSLDLTQQGQVVGNPLYMSPEQARDKELDGRSDIYSLGCLLFHMLSGAPPYSGNSLIELVSQHTNSPVARLRDVASPMDSDAKSPLAESAWLELEHTAAKCMSKNPNDRFDSMEDLKEHLERIELPAAQPFPPILEAGSASPKHDDSSRTWSLLAVTVCLFGGLALWLLSSSTTPKEGNTPTPNGTISPTLQRPKDILIENGKSLWQLTHEIEKGKTRLDLTFAALTPEYFDCLSKAKEIKNLTLINCTGVTKEGMEKLVKSKVRIRDLVIDGSDIDDAGLKLVARLNGLRVVRMRTCLVHTTSRGIGDLGTCPTLMTINANDTRLDDDGVKKLARCKTLTNLKMANTNVTDKSGEYLSNAKQFEVFDFSETRFGDAGLKHLYALPSLNMLFLRGLKISDTGLAGFMHHQRLKSLYLGGSKGITDRTIEMVKTLPSIESLDLSATSVTSKSLADLSTLKTLRLLNIAGLPFSPSDRFDLARNLPNCKIVDTKSGDDD